MFCFAVLRIRINLETDHDPTFLFDADSGPMYHFHSVPDPANLVFFWIRIPDPLF